MLAQMHKVVCVVDSGRTFGLNLTGREAEIRNPRPRERLEF
jgi:hypothetical protein